MNITPEDMDSIHLTDVEEALNKTKMEDTEEVETHDNHMQEVNIPSLGHEVAALFCAIVDMISVPCGAPPVGEDNTAMLGGHVDNVLAFQDIQMSQKTQAYVGLAGASLMIGAPRYFIIRKKLAENKAASAAKDVTPKAEESAGASEDGPRAAMPE